jgi:hypothetical protein
MPAYSLSQLIEVMVLILCSDDIDDVQTGELGRRVGGSAPVGRGARQIFRGSMVHMLTKLVNTEPMFQKRANALSDVIE